MISQLIERLMAGVAINVPNVGDPALPALSAGDAVLRVLSADPFDLMLHMEQVWNTFNPWAPNPAPAGPARTALWSLGAFARYAPAPGPLNPPAWHHLAYSYVLENTRAVQILRRVVREFRSGEGLGVPTVSTQRWLDATEVLLMGAANPMAPWLSTSTVRQDAEAVRRNAYWRLFGMDLAFGTDDNRPPSYDKALASNASFVPLFEELLHELWQAIINETNFSGVNNSDTDRIFRIAEELQYVLRSRRQSQILAREELAAATILGWVEMTLLTDTPVVIDLKANASSSDTRLRLIGERVGLSCHSKASAFFSMASEISLLLRTVESSVLNPGTVGALYAPTTALGQGTRRVITEWAAATGKDLKARTRPVQTTPARRLVSVN